MLIFLHMYFVTFFYDGLSKLCTDDIILSGGVEYMWTSVEVCACWKEARRPTRIFTANLIQSHSIQKQAFFSYHLIDCITKSIVLLIQMNFLMYSKNVKLSFFKILGSSWYEQEERQQSVILYFCCNPKKKKKKEHQIISMVRIHYLYFSLAHSMDNIKPDAIRPMDENAWHLFRFTNWTWDYLWTRKHISEDLEGAKINNQQLSLNSRGGQGKRRT